MAVRVKLVAWILLLALNFGVFSKPQALPAAPWQAKVDPWVMDTAASGETEFLVFLTEQADLSGASALKSKLDKGQFVFERLTEVAERAQKPILETLAASGLEYRPYWIANMIWVRGDLPAIQAIAVRDDVALLYANPVVHLDEPEPVPLGNSILAVNSIEWNISKIRAPEVWEAGYTGQGVVIGGQDTGYDWSHPALKHQYRGWDGVIADHDYNWHDAIHESVDNYLCGNDASAPCDDHGHGTHTMGIAVGRDAGLTNQIGVAPGARWIGCRNMDQGVGTPATYSECYQWFLAPTDLQGQNPDPARAPDIINNSWGCPFSEGCTDPDVLLSVVEAVRAAGILTVHSAGNDGNSSSSGCATINTPAAIYDASFTVGNTNFYDSISASSSRGPVTVDGSNRLKPDISAPGTGIRSSAKGGSYTTLSGTSMSAPHVAGLAALLISAQPLLRGQVDELERLIELTSVALSNSETCGGTPGTTVPNNIYGWGRIDGWAALQGNVLSVSNSVSDLLVVSGGTITYSLTVFHTAAIHPTTDVILMNTLPANTTFFDATGDFVYDPGSASISWIFPTFGPMESRTVELVVQVQPGFTGIIENNNYVVYSKEVTHPVAGDPVQTEVVHAYGMLLSPDYHGVTWPGGQITYTHNLANTGSNTDIYDVSLSSNQGWSEPLNFQAELASGESMEVVITVSVPEGAPLGASDTGYLTATSQTDPEITLTVIDQTTVGMRYLFPIIVQEP